MGDNPNWGKVVAKARDGAPDALEAVGHGGEPTTHPVCKEVLAAVSAGGTKGTELYHKFTGSPYGWPKDAVNGAILTLLAAGQHPGRPGRQGAHRPEGAAAQPDRQGNLLQGGRAADDGPAAQLRGLLTAAGIQYQPGQEGAQIPALLQRLKDLAGRAGGPRRSPNRSTPSTSMLSSPSAATSGSARLLTTTSDWAKICSVAGCRPAAREAGAPMAASSSACFATPRDFRSPQPSHRLSPRSATAASSSTTPTRPRRCSPS